MEMCKDIGYEVQYGWDHAENLLLAFVFYNCSEMARMRHAGGSIVKRPTPLDEIIIYLDREPCESCLECNRCFKRYTSIDVILFKDGEQQGLEPEPEPPTVSESPSSTQKSRVNEPATISHVVDLPVVVYGG